MHLQVRITHCNKHFRAILDKSYVRLHVYLISKYYEVFPSEGREREKARGGAFPHLKLETNILNYDCVWIYNLMSTSSEENKLRKFIKKMQRKIFGPKTKEMTRD